MCRIPREQVVAFSVREDGFELDKLVGAIDGAYTPSGTGPDETAKLG
jgi:hypothetical protein